MLPSSISENIYLDLHKGELSKTAQVSSLCLQKLNRKATSLFVR